MRSANSFWTMTTAVLKSCSRSLKMIGVETLYGRLLTKTSNSGKGTFTASPWMSLSLSPYVPDMYSARMSSSSMHVRSHGRSAMRSVRMPSPGPTSSTLSPSRMPA